MKDNFLFEIGTEEIPASYILPALSQLEKALIQLLEKEGLGHENIISTATPRRLTVFISNVAVRQEDREELFTGPAMDVAYKDGAPSKAASGFARSRGATVDECITVKRNDREYLAVKKLISGKDTAVILQENLPSIISKIIFPKSMRWTKSSLRFARPVRWIMALMGDKVIDITFGDVRSSSFTQGHRFLKKEDRLQIGRADWGKYLEILEENGVIADYSRRKKAIINFIVQAQKKYNPVFSEENISKELLEEVTFLCEYPSIGEGTFSEKYLDLPDPVLITTMTHHQKYFPVYDTQWKLKPLFLFIFNNLPEYEQNIRKGNEKVLRARLEDALFFYQEDLRESLYDRTERLDGILFQKGLGSYLDKVKRLEVLGKKMNELSETVDSRLCKAAFICKSDLTTHLVYEYPELQGIIGSIYARESGEEEEIARSIEEHYYPRQQNDAIPATETGKRLSVIDKFDTLTGLLGNGNIPSGSKDPFGLRRAALGIVRIMMEGELDFDLTDLYEPAYNLFHSLQEESLSLKQNLFSFIKQRLIHYLSQEKGFRDDLVDACFPVLNGNYYHNYLKVKALSEIAREPQFEDLTTSFKRIGNIILQAREKFPDWKEEAPQEELLKEAAEKQLHDTFINLQKDFDALSQSREYLLLLQKFSELRKDVDRFFDEVLVMDPDEKLRYNRFNLLSQLNRTFLIVADFTKIRGEQTGS